MSFECRIRINALKAYNRLNNASIGSHHVSWRELGTAQREFVKFEIRGEIMTPMYMGHTTGHPHNLFA